MIHQLLIYCSTDMYKYGNMELSQQRSWRFDVNGPDMGAEDYILKFKDRFRRKQYSELHIMQLAIDPATGVCDVMKNEFAQNPLKTKIVINAAAAQAKPVPKKSINFDWANMAVGAMHDETDPTQQVTITTGTMSFS